MAALETAAGTISAHDLRLREQTAFGELIQSLKLQNSAYCLSPRVQGEQSAGRSWISTTCRSTICGYQAWQACGKILVSCDTYYKGSESGTVNSGAVNVFGVTLLTSSVDSCVCIGY